MRERVSGNAVRELRPGAFGRYSGGGNRLADAFVRHVADGRTVAVDDEAGVEPAGRRRPRGSRRDVRLAFGGRP